MERKSLLRLCRWMIKYSIILCIENILEEKIIVATQLGNKCKCYNHVLISSEYSFSRNVIVCRSISTEWWSWQNWVQLPCPYLCAFMFIICGYSTQRRQVSIISNCVQSDYIYCSVIYCICYLLCDNQLKYKQ